MSDEAILDPPPGSAPAADPLDRLEQSLQEEFPPEIPGAEIPGGAPPAEELLDRETVGALLAFPFELIAARNGDHWSLTDGERKALVPLATRVANKWTPILVAKFADELALATVLLVVLEKRVRIDRAKARDAAAPKDGPPPPVRS